MIHFSKDFSNIFLINLTDLVKISVIWVAEDIFFSISTLKVV
jgi:hypothetical protein